MSWYTCILAILWSAIAVAHNHGSIFYNSSGVLGLYKRLLQIHLSPVIYRVQNQVCMVNDLFLKLDT
jgi:hypothetical protein